MESKFEKKTLRYDFTASEIHDLSIQLAQKNKDAVNLENEQKAVASQYGSKLKVLKSEIGKLSNQVADGWELKEIECEVLYHVPKKGMKTYVRKDNGQRFEERMDSYEWNLFTQEANESGMPENIEETDFEEVKDDKKQPALPAPSEEK